MTMIFYTKLMHPFDPDTSNYIPLTDDKMWAFRDMD